MANSFLIEMNLEDFECVGGILDATSVQRNKTSRHGTQDRKCNSTDVIDALTDLFIVRSVPAYIRSNNGTEFIAEVVRRWIKAIGANTAYIKPGSPWENGYCESFNARFRDELLIGEILYSLREAQIVIEQWQQHYNTKRPHSALGHKPPAPESFIPMEKRPIMRENSNRTKP